MNFNSTDLLLLTTKNNQYYRENYSLLLINKERVFYDRISSPESSLENKTVVNNNVASSVFLVAFALTIIIILLQLARIRRELKHADDNLANYKNNLVKNSSLIPCKNCRFYDNNSYLKCAVNPTKVLKPEAIECSDYSSQAED